MHVRRFAVVIVFLALFYLSHPQASKPPADNVLAPFAADQLVYKQFGAGFALLADFPAIMADFDGDGVSDLAVAAHAVNPLLNAVEYHYKVIDPYHSFYGFGDPKVTMQFGTDDPRLKGMVVLIIHGTEPDAWRAATPKAKFVVVKLPFTKLERSQVLVHKKPVGAIAAEETDTVSSVIYWDGKKYKYTPNGSSSN